MPNRYGEWNKETVLEGFCVAIVPVDDEVSEKIEITGSILADFTIIKTPTLMELKVKYEHLRGKMFYRTSSEEYPNHLILVDSTFCKIPTERVSKSLPEDPIVEGSTFGWVVHGGKQTTHACTPRRQATTRNCTPLTF